MWGKTGGDFPLVALNPRNPLCTLPMNTHCLGVALGQITQLRGTESAEYKERALRFIIPVAFTRLRKSTGLRQQYRSYLAGVMQGLTAGQRAV